MPGNYLPAACLRASFRHSVALLLLALPFTASHAALTLSSTRIVFDSDKSSTSIIIRNPSKQPYAVQTWVNTVDDNATVAVPFLVVPQLFRLSPGQAQQVQINRLPNHLPNDRESLFFFNAQEIPQANKEAGNVLNIALRTRIKLFYRPQQIKGSPSGHLKQLEFSLHDKDGQPHLQVNNPTPFHFTFSRLEISDKGQQKAVKAIDMVAPFAQQTYPAPGIKPGAGLQVRFSIINDFGGYSEPVTQPISLAR
ncbi:molecular chaperone [Pseudomonas sp. zfem004]|uniref:fimbrial biogenesis chaperone n=1 Tax=unclassified Pseudomonas TaxID=196821 RepID=UPI00129B47FA|nr:MULTISPECIES: molecular chaperone [unclassified Pseudomonas]MDU9405530.1 molecular chaperone [Pseudomonas sp. zfem004]